MLPRGVPLGPEGRQRPARARGELLNRNWFGRRSETPADSVSNNNKDYDDDNWQQRLQ